MLYSNAWTHLECVQINDKYEVELFVLDSNTWTI